MKEKRTFFKLKKVSAILKISFDLSQLFCLDSISTLIICSHHFTRIALSLKSKAKAAILSKSCIRKVPVANICIGWMVCQMG